LRLTYRTKLFGMDPSRLNTASWSARDYVGRSYVYTLEKMLPTPAKEGSESVKEAAKPEATGTTNLETGETNKKPRTSLPTSRPQKKVFPDKETKTSRRAKKPKVAKKSKKSSKTGKTNCWEANEIEEQAEPLEKES
jgi:hypothetical protein